MSSVEILTDDHVTRSHDHDWSYGKAYRAVPIW